MPKSQREGPDSAAANQPGAAPLRPLPKVRMTYPSGNEPHQVCNASHPGATTAQAAAGSKDSRIKAAARRLAAPGKWFGGKDKAEAGNKQEPKAP